MIKLISDQAKPKQSEAPYNLGHYHKLSHVLDVTDNIQVPDCPVFRPKISEFKDFQGYLEKCEKMAGNSAIFKVRVICPNLSGIHFMESLKFNFKLPNIYKWHHT